MKVLEQVALELLKNVVADNLSIMAGDKGWRAMYKDKDKDDLIIALEKLDTNFGLFDFILTKFPHFDSDQFERVIDFLVDTEFNQKVQFLAAYPEYKEIDDILNRPFQ